MEQQTDNEPGILSQIIGTILLVGIVAVPVNFFIYRPLQVWMMAKATPQPPPTPVVVEPPPPSPQELQRGYAQDLAQDIVEKTLRSPSTASWVVRDVVAEQPPHYVVHIVVDAQNGFGATIRDSFLVALEVVDARNYKFQKFSAMIRSQDPPTPGQIATMKQANWPDAPVAPAK